MLVLSRKMGQKLLIGGGVAVTVLEIHGNRVRLGVEAPGHIDILREELTTSVPAGCPPGDAEERS